MPYSVTSPWDAATSAAGSFMSGMADERKYAAEQERLRRTDAYQQALAQQGAARLTLEQNRDTREGVKADEAEADRQTGIKHQDAIDAQNKHIANTPIPHPPNWDKLPPSQQQDYYASYMRHRLAAQQGLPGNEAGIKTTMEQLRSYEEQANNLRTKEAQAHALAITQAGEDRRAAQRLQQEWQLAGMRLSDEDAREMVRISHEDARQDKGIAASAAAASTQRKFTRAEHDRSFHEQEHLVKLRGDVSAENAAKKTGGAGKIDPEHVKEWQTLNSGLTGLRMARLSPQVLNSLQTGVYKFGLNEVRNHLQAAAAGKATIAGMSQQEAALAIKVLSGGH